MIVLGSSGIKRLHTNGRKVGRARHRYYVDWTKLQYVRPLSVADRIGSLVGLNASESIGRGSDDSLVCSRTRDKSGNCEEATCSLIGTSNWK